MSNSFDQNTDTLAKMFDSIVVPKGFLLNGLHGLLVVIFKTDDPEMICAEIELLTLAQTQDLASLVDNLLSNINTQKDGVIWKFNNPQSALDDILSLASEPNSKPMLASEIKVVSPTFPYIEGFYSELESKDQELQKSKVSPQISATDVLAPLVTLGSIYTASRLLSN
jgi:hypothetical protein